MKINIIALIAFFFSAVGFAGKTHAEESLKNYKLFEHYKPATLNVLLVIDEDFDDISESDVAQMLKTAAFMFKDKFGAPAPEFKFAGRMSIERFFADNLDRKSADFADYEARRFKVGTQNDVTQWREKILAFLKRWKIEELQAFFPEEERANYDSYEKLYDGVVAQMNSKLAEISRIKINGRSILDPSKIEYRSYQNWRLLFKQLTQYDLIITNTFILYDAATQPFPHSIFTSCKVGGFSSKSPKLTALGGRGIMANTFGMDTRIPFFIDPLQGEVSRCERNEIIGAFVLAHEMGHALFKLPDHYDHPDSCLMNNRMDISYAQGYRLLIDNPGTCPKCAIWMTARSYFWDGEFYFEQKEYSKAIAAYMQAARSTPKNIDGSYQEYMALIAYKISKAWFEP